MKLKKGDKVILNEKYAEYEDHKGEIYTCMSDPWLTGSGDEIVLLDRDFKGGYSTDGLAKLTGYIYGE